MTYTCEGYEYYLWPIPYEDSLYRLFRVTDTVCEMVPPWRCFTVLKAEKFLSELHPTSILEFKGE